MKYRPEMKTIPKGMIRIRTIVLLVTILLSACTDHQLDFEGIVGKGDAPNTKEATIETTDAGPVLTIRYREGVVLPNISVPVTITEKLSDYEIVRSDTKEKYTLIPSHYGSHLYACTECAYTHEKMIPVFWIKNPK